ncbi:MAG TPA: hypothetical protein ENI30_07195, partial [Gammaproteobacteria bacterium]|nr:hypothetical protein [Gammaproteobacteria bacterium]
MMLFGVVLTGVVYRLLERRHVLPPDQFAASARGATRTSIIQAIGTARDDQQTDDPEDVGHCRHKPGGQVAA